FVKGITNGSVSDSQISAFAMAVFFKGMPASEQWTLTSAMAHSGTVMNWQEQGFDGLVVDKHSTGGVGDKLSLMLAPMAAAAGAYVPMISGRGLGHTGGTLDKLDSVPGYNTTPDLELFRAVVKEVGCAVIGQTGELAPADKRFYGIRDVTATVETIPLITASILSKKRAAGLNALVMDVKAGSGAFIDDIENSIALAKNLISVGAVAGLPVTALITDMDQVLGKTAGNSLEVIEAVDFLSGKERHPRMLDITVGLVGAMLHGVGITNSQADGENKAKEVLENGKAYELFEKMVAALGGPTDFCSKPEQYLPAAPVIRAVQAEKSGSILKMNVKAVGMAVVALGGGRTSSDQKIDHRVGLSNVLGLGDDTSADTPLCMVHAASEADADEAEARILAAVDVGEGDVMVTPAIRQFIYPDDAKG
ncbi:MAG: thymidine phosphorylase, partial [Sphingomonadales bacterium]|nr:thymidine phosphorylase [Sphingomonadales bacterium]